MSTSSFFKKFTPAGSTPIVAQKRVVKTSNNSSSDEYPRKTHSNSNSKQSSSSAPRRVASSVTLAVTKRSITSSVPPTKLQPQNQNQKRTLEASRSSSTPNLKRHATDADIRPQRPTKEPKTESPTLIPPQPPPPRHCNGSAIPKATAATAAAAPSVTSVSSVTNVASTSARNTVRSATSLASGASAASPTIAASVASITSRPASSRSPHSSRLESSDESSTDERSIHPLSFRSKDPKTGKPIERPTFIHAHDIANVKLPGWSRRREFRTTDSLHLLGLHYPGIADQEKFDLVHNADPDEFEPLAEILTTMELVSSHLCPPAVSDLIHSETSGGIVYRMRRGLKHGDSVKFLENLRSYNQLIRENRRNGTFKRIIGGMSQVPFPLVEHILQQSYARTVALQVEKLQEYKSFSSEVYGELLPKFTAKIFKEAGLNSSKVFMDLGSGTGNVVLHAALECGCESWGCEKMSTPAELAEKQRIEFLARCRMWGINHGAVHLRHDTFLENRAIAETMKRADVLLVNNFAFEAELNQKLLDMFLDLKEGAIVISLKPFVPQNHVITRRNKESPVNRLRMVEREYFSREVSWTDSGGKYYVHTVDGSMLREFMEREERREAEGV
ncbi:Similar to Histone-lysine N-methyltransferase, H3 lysine-79 specific; acc. no. Q4WVH4 [Pyronema omphalodes CBS 100304]|uniref:Histone-lysine N-methyltransferase, H3 lysine-79 specific n=1 Tax=Pyronema omphalodes (strain CBS 100304) TaxID=1076935 RepID=U4LPF9_PYROM|nr:Similar to Histone-lysine N-methyltransferase, H3 lysine-79 specific; acc. no. Q4WVH4 [Pyronema omphalodes CBS 100304]